MDKGIKKTKEKEKKRKKRENRGGPTSETEDHVIRFIPHTGKLLKHCLRRNGIRNSEISFLNPKTKTPEIKVFPKPVQLLAYSYLLL